jgi:hypothetical protein
MLAPFLDSAYPGRLAIDRVLGRVRLWGKVIACERGWRAECAYPDHIYVPNWATSKRPPHQSLEIAAGLGDYGVPVSLLPARARPEIIASIEQAAA